MWNICSTTMNPLFTLQTFDWATTNPFSTDTTEIKVCSHSPSTIQNLQIYSLSDIHVQSFPIKRFLPLLILLHYLFDCFTTQIKIICIQQLQKRIIPHTLSYSIHKNDKTRSRSSKNLSFSTLGLLSCWQ